MNVYQLFWFALKAILRGRGSAPVWFDTEARTYEYHYARVSSINYIGGPGSGEEIGVSLYEDKNVY